MTLFRFPAKQKPIAVESSAFAAAIESAERMGDTKRVEVWIEVSHDPPNGRVEHFEHGAVRWNMRLGRRWTDWALFWKGPWSTYNADRARYEPDVMTLTREAEKAGARSARVAVRTTLFK